METDSDGDSSEILLAALAAPNTSPDTKNVSNSNSSSTDLSSENGEENVMNNANSNNEDNKNRFYTENSSRKWASTSPPSSRARAAKIFNKKAGPKVQVQNEIEVF